MNGDERGQGLVEYGLILVLVAIVVIVVLLLSGPAIRHEFCLIFGHLGESFPCDTDAALSVADIVSSVQQPPQEWDDARESIIVLWEEAEAQEDGLQEGMELAAEAIGEGLEVLIDFADDNDDPVLSESLSQLLQQVNDGNLDAVPDVIASLLDELAEVPLEVGTAMSLEVAPRLVASCETVSAGLVSPEPIAAALEAVEQLDEDHPGRAEALQLLQEAVEIIEGRNDAIQDYLGAHSTVLDFIIAGLESAGEWDLAAEIAAASVACEN
jgi:pilus assembly protein Flp/PilA